MDTFLAEAGRPEFSFRLLIARFRLDRPQTPANVFGHKVDTGVSAPPARPVFPQPNLAKLACVFGIVRQVPLANALKLPAPPNWVGVKSAQEISERGHAQPFA